MDLRQLTYFVTVAEEGGIRPAARRLYIAQPAISQSLARLEREMGVALLHRTRQGARLTAAGGELLLHARDILQRIEEARTAVGLRATTGVPPVAPLAASA